MDQLPLAGLRIVELAGTQAAALAVLFLAEAGADVIRVEPPTGDPLRTAAPGAFAVHNRSKQSLALDLAEAAGQEALARLLAGADVLVHQHQPGSFGGLLGPDRLAARFPHLLVSTIGSWPAGHPRSAMPVDEALVLADAGVFDEQPPVGRDGPGFVRFRLGEGGAAYLAAIGILARLFQAGRGAGGRANTSLIQGAMSSMLMLWSRAEHSTPALDQGHKREVNATIFQCADGKWMHVMSNPDTVPAMAAGLATMDEAARTRAARDYPAWTAAVPNAGANAVIFRTKPLEFWLEELRAHDIAVEPCLALGELYGNEQARCNGYVVDVDDPVLGPTEQPGPPFAIKPPARVRNFAPRLDDGRATAAQWSAQPRPVPDALHSETAAMPLPLAGLKVLDFGSYLAGPLAPMIMGDLGAEVIKLEMTTGDAMRFVEWAFNGCQRGKRSISLDLKHPDARPVLERLVQWADVVHHNLRMPAARKLGIDYESLARINPDIVYCHVSSYGPVGPRKDWPGFDQMMQSSCGWEYEGAGAGNRPTWFRFGMMDHHCAMASLIATLLGLIQRKADSKGRSVAASLLGAGMVSLRETVRLPDGSLTPYPQLDHEQLGTSPERRLLACADGWIMAVTEAEGAAARLRQALGAATIDEVAARLAAMPAAEAKALVEQCGGLAALAREDQRVAFLTDPANLASGIATVCTHRTYGRLEQVGTLIHFADPHPVQGRPPPGLGEHSREIAAELGFAAAAIDDLLARRIMVGT